MFNNKPLEILAAFALCFAAGAAATTALSAWSKWCRQHPRPSSGNNNVGKAG